MSRQSIVLVLAIAIWAVVRVPALDAAIASYAAAWLFVNAIAAWRPAVLDFAGGGARARAVSALIVVVAGSSLWSMREALAEGESLLGVVERTRDRMRLESNPAIAPPLLRTDQPQTFYVNALSGVDVRVSFGPGTERLRAREVGEGLFRVEYDPRRDGAPTAVDGEIEAAIDVDGSRSTRAMQLVRPLAHPRWLRTSPSGALAAAVSEETDELVVVDAQGLVSRVEVGDGPSDATFLDDARVLVTHRWEPALWVVDARTKEVERRVEVGAPQVRVAVSAGLDRVAVCALGPSARPEEGEVVVLTLPSFEREGALDGDCDWVLFGASGDLLVMSTVRPPALLRGRRDDTGRWRADGEPLRLGRPAVTLGRVPDGHALWVATTDYRADGAPHLANHFVQDQILTVDVDRWRVSAQRLTARRTTRQSGPGNTDRGVSPMGIAFVSPDAALVAFAGTDEIERMTPARVEPQITALDDYPLAAPHGVAVLADGTVVVSSPSSGTLGLFTPDMTLRTLVRLTADEDALLRDAPDALARRMGEHGFYESTRAGIACQSCHMHADTDFVRRNIGERRLGVTLSVRGLAGTAPYLRDASYPRIRDLDELSQTLFRGYERRAPGRGLVLEAYVASLPRVQPRVDGPRDSARERRGVEIFVRAGCVTCHAFPAFTNLGQHPLGAVFPDRTHIEPANAVLDTPSLLSVAEHAPYLHDGRSPTLTSIFRDHNTSNRHGDTQALDDEELGDLVHFLESL